MSNNTDYENLDKPKLQGRKKSNEDEPEPPPV